MRSAVFRFLRNQRSFSLAILDSLGWFIGIYAGAAIRLETLDPAAELYQSDAAGNIPLYGCLVLALAASAIHLTLAWFLKLHQGRHGLGSFEELFTLTSVVLGTACVILVANWTADPSYLPRTSPLTAAAAALFFQSWPRALWRIQVNQQGRGVNGPATTPVIIAGAGDGGRELVRAMHRDPSHAWHPVAFVDDDRRKRHFRYQGVAVRGTTDDLDNVAFRTRAHTIIIAMPSASAEAINRINDAAIAADLQVKVLPGVDDLLGDVSLADVRDLEPADLLGRTQIDTDLESIADYLTERTVLVTGAGGSIGSELCRQITQFNPKLLLMLDRDESALHGLALSMAGRADLDEPGFVLADIRDPEALHDVFARHRPDVVFHAAALKHVNMLEGHPFEAFKTNVLGTANVLEAARAAGVSRFVNISTDKAASPENVLGYTKRLAEGLTAETGSTADGTYLSVRFGNVLGTRGSVLTTFQAQIDRGGPVTVTDPEVTRFFMTVNEAVQLVIQAAAIGRDGEALVLDMGTPVKIIDVARQMIQQSRRDIEIVITGLHPGEKLHEVLFADDEADDRPFHPLVSHVSVPTVTVDALKAATFDGDIVAYSERLAGDCATMNTSRTVMDQ